MCRTRVHVPSLLLHLCSHALYISLSDSVLAEKSVKVVASCGACELRLLS